MVHQEYHFRLHLQKRFVIDEEIDADIIRTYSLLDSIRVMGESNHIGSENIGMSVLTLAFVVIAPLVRSLFGMVLWFSPMSGNAQKAVAGAIEFLNVVAAADCFSITAFLMIWQLPKLFEQMEEAAEYMELQLSPCVGLYVFAVAGFIDTFVSSSIYYQYMAAAEYKVEAHDIDDPEAASPPLKR